MYVMRSEEKRLLDEYRALGTPEEIRRRLSSPYPQADEGYAPMPLSDHEKVKEMLKVYPSKPDSGLLVDDGEDSNYKINDGLEWQR